MVTQPTVEQEDRTFISKVVEFIQTLPGCDKERLIVQTNTSFPSRYVLVIRKLPMLKDDDFQTIVTLAPRLRDMVVSMKLGFIKIDMWKYGAKQRKKKRKNVSRVKKAFNLKTIPESDKPMLTRILNGLANLPSLPCQFHVSVKSEPPDYYHVDIISNDIISLEELKDFKVKFRAFVKTIEFNFPQNSIRLKIERATADTTAAVGNRRMVTVYKRNKNI
tara:strand:- start:369 stop:1025 length:657 start_codon:yes stop_codon:yes gene_type:complete